MAGRAGLRFHAVLSTGDGDPGPGGDRVAAAPQPGRDTCCGFAYNHFKHLSLLAST